MRNSLGVTLGAVLALGLLGACSKTEDTAVNATEATADTAAATTDGAMAPGGAVSPPADNAAVDTTAMADGSTAAASNSFTEGQARGHIENAGYTDVTGLMKTPEGLWTGKAMKDGKTHNVSLDFKGAVTAN